MLNPKFLSKAPIATKQQPKAIAGLSDARIDLYPLKKNSLLIISRQGIVDQHLDF